jgi:EAL domain-containing protein (putative c-di-GMP-specific phosphodiesterase class I)
MHVKQRVTSVENISEVRWALTGATDADAQVKTWELNQTPFQIGRRSELALNVPSPVVSGLHAEVILSGARVIIRDNDSTNGTWVNGNRVTNDCSLFEGDVVEIGDAVFRLHDADQSEATNQTSPLLNKTISVTESDERIAQRNLTQLLKDKSLLPCYQALHSLETGQICGYEFLARSCWPGIESAPQLFELARVVGREVELSSVCRERAMYYSPLLEPKASIFVNTHPVEPLLEVVVPQMCELRVQYPDLEMVLEIHEAAITEPNLIREARQQLAESDVRLAFDDFGRGQARIRELICAQSDYIKFDSALISDLQHVLPEQFKFFRSIIRGIQEAGAITVAEGVETEAMADVCREIGFDLVQGFLFSRPTIMGSD